MCLFLYASCVELVKLCIKNKSVATILMYFECGAARYRLRDWCGVPFALRIQSHDTARSLPRLYLATWNTFSTCRSVSPYVPVRGSNDHIFATMTYRYTLVRLLVRLLQASPLPIHSNALFRPTFVLLHSIFKND